MANWDEHWFCQSTVQDLKDDFVQGRLSESLLKESLAAEVGTKSWQEKNVWTKYQIDEIVFYDFPQIINQLYKTNKQ